MNKQQFLAIFGLFIATIIIVFGAWILLSPKPSSTQGYITDRDTGETYDARDTVITGGGNTIGVKVFGLEKLINSAKDKGIANTDFTTSVRDAITKYNEMRLGNTYTTITLRPQSTTITKSRITSQIRLGQEDTFATITANIYGNGKTAIVTITGASKPAFVYVGQLDTIDQTLYTISQSSYDGPEISIDSFTYREAALDDLENLGYHIPDLDIKFMNYENPFL